MITSDDNPPPDPSSSDYQNQQIFNDEKAFASVSNIDLLKSLIAYLDDPNNPLPSFSIRDYVFDSRSKDIASNWPFSRKSLQICLQHGVKNLLPPFQSLESLRNHRRSNKEIMNTSNGNPIDDRSLSSKSLNTKSKKTLLVSSQSAIKKCKKLNSSVEPVEDVAIMASKVCPVCKTFSSSSNTTLNAHIDQCLSGESSMKWIANPKVMVKHRIKPRKTRLMVDIYKTAPRCTVEELDARNGTGWVNNSSFHDQELKFHGEEQKETAIITPVVADHEGAVYIDTNGTKVRILSVPKLGESVNNGAQKLLKKKKNKDHEQKHQQKYLKLSTNKDHGASEVIKENCVKEDQGEQREERINMDDLPIIRPPWACSKRTVLARKFTGNFQSRTPPRSSDNTLQYKEQHPMNNNSTLSREPASKFNLKRKFSALKRSKEKTVAGPLQDSSQQRSRVEEDTNGKILEVGNNEFRWENSVASKSSNKDSSTRVKTDLTNPLLDVEVIGKETRSHNEQVLNPDMFCADFIKESMHISGVNDDHIENRQNYFYGVDPIQIPGPPGSFLPSPGEDIMASYQEHQESMSDSPISTISDPSLARSDSRSSEKFSLRSTNSLKDNINEKYASGFNGFKNDQPCCCSRKEVASSQTVASNHQGSTLFTKRAFEFLNFRSEMFPQAPETVTSAINPLKPVLRLMGKNLTVEKTDEDASSSQQFRQYSMGQFPNHHHFLNQNQYGSPNDSRTQVDSRPIHALDTTFMHKDSPKESKPVKEIIVIDDSPGDEEDDDRMRVRRGWESLLSSNPVHNRMHSGYQSQSSSMAFGNGGFQASLPFMEVSRSYYPPRFS